MKRLACIFGRHRWTIHDEHGEVYEACSRCGKRARYFKTFPRQAAASAATWAAAAAASAAEKLRCWLGLSSGHERLRRLDRPNGVDALVEQLGSEVVRVDRQDAKAARRRFTG
jgi:hypothetical protein